MLGDQIGVEHVGRNARKLIPHQFLRQQFRPAVLDDSAGIFRRERLA